MARRRGGTRGGGKRRGRRDGRTRGAVLLAVLLVLVIGYAVYRELRGGERADAVTVYEDGLDEGVCEGILNSYECAAAMEAQALPALGDRARRSGDTLVLRLAAGDSIVLVDPPSDDAYDDPSYHVVGRMSTGHLVVHGQYYEGSFYMAVNERTGEEHRLWARPVVSPDGERVMVASMDVAAGYNNNGFQIWRVRGGRLGLEWSIEPEAWGPLDARWADTTAIHFLKEGWCDDGTGFCRTPAVLELVNGQWRIRDTGEPERVTS